jgi:outer membrane lipoprotein-sorting protein
MYLFVKFLLGLSVLACLSACTEQEQPQELKENVANNQISCRLKNAQGFGQHFTCQRI